MAKRNAGGVGATAQSIRVWLGTRLRGGGAPLGARETEIRPVAQAVRGHAGRQLASVGHRTRPPTSEQAEARRRGAATDIFKFAGRSTDPSAEHEKSVRATVAEILASAALTRDPKPDKMAPLVKAAVDSILAAHAANGGAAVARGSR